MPKIRARRKDSGYMLLLLMVAVAMLTITMLGVARNYRREIQRDREVEMIHRGEQYARAVQRYYRKYGTYPTSIEQLLGVNNIRFLRKKYKDPMSPDGEWKLAHPTDIKLTPAGGLTPAAGTVTGAATAPANAVDTGANANSTSQSAFGTSQSTGSTSQSAFGTSASGINQNTDSTSTSTTGATPTSGNNLAQGTGALGSSMGGTGTNSNAANPVLGGGPLLGVVSKQTTEGIHSFGDKTKYSEWYFIYDPTQDKGQLLVGPYNPKMFVGSANSGLGNSNKGSSAGGQPTTPSSGSPTTPSVTSPSMNTPSSSTPSTTP
jgi:type II secretory pathway pseudopilin PulG